MPPCRRSSAKTQVAVLCGSLTNHGDVVQTLGNGRLTLSCQGDHRIGQIEQRDDARGLRIICPQNAVARLLEEPAVPDVFHVLSVEEVACDGRTKPLGDEFVGRGIGRRRIVDRQTLAAVSHPIVQVSTAAFGSAEMPSFSGRSISRALDKSV